MPQVDFYILPTSAPEQRLEYSCKLTAKAWQEGLRVYLYCASPEQAKDLDQRLWHFRAERFLPHDGFDSGPDSPIVVSDQAPPAEPGGLLINLAPEIPLEHVHFSRIAELVIDEPISRQILREHFRFYRERGYPLRDHRLTHC